MGIFTEDRARAVLENVIRRSKADECTAALDGGLDGNIRFAKSSVTTTGVVSNTELAVRVAFGRRVGTATVNAFDDASIQQVVARAEETARLAPENPEFMPAIEKQAYRPSDTFFERTAGITPELRASIAAQAIGPCQKEGVVAAGFLADGQRFSAIANSKGNFGYQTSTALDFTCTVRTEDGRGSAWLGRNLADVGRLDVKADMKGVIEKTKRSVDPKPLAPGKYTVILEPAAGAGLLLYMAFGFDARRADEGRSFLAKKGGGNRLGEKMFDSRVHVYADPWHPETAALPWDEEGLSRERTEIIRDGVVSYLHYSRYWAKEKGKRAVGLPGNLIMDGADASLEDLIRSTERGVLVSRTWYIRMVDPETLLLTGLTRDGTFYIENGEIRHPVQNFRFNESPALMLQNLEALGRPERVGDDDMSFLMMIPPMKVRDFTFTSQSDAV